MFPSTRRQHSLRQSAPHSTCGPAVRRAITAFFSVLPSRELHAIVATYSSATTVFCCFIIAAFSLIQIMAGCKIPLLYSPGNESDPITLQHNTKEKGTRKGKKRKDGKPDPHTLATTDSPEASSLPTLRVGGQLSNIRRPQKKKSRDSGPRTVHPQKICLVAVGSRRRSVHPKGSSGQSSTGYGS